jgi:glycosyltransferase A (GT-A) superfamily protein (DUF2064 family)
MRAARALVVAKAPRSGHAKTRLGVDVGMERAAELAASALLDTLRTCTSAFGARACFLALDGDLATAVEGDRLVEAVRGWTVFRQRGDGLAERLVRAHLDTAGAGPGPVVQVGMDTPQATVADLRSLAEELVDHDAVLGDAEDGGWWAPGLNDARGAAVLRGLPMSTSTTGTATRRALERAGLSVASGRRLRDVDTSADADAVAGLCAGGSEFARRWEGRWDAR